jgi:hypothetical protein
MAAGTPDFDVVLWNWAPTHPIARGGKSVSFFEVKKPLRRRDHRDGVM